MKKIIISISLVLFIFVSVSAQGDSLFKNKRGIPMLPQKGDIAIGISMVPIFQYLGNSFNGHDAFNNAPNANFLSPPNINFPNAPVTNSIYLKYFVQDNAALRFSFGYNAYTINTKFYVRDDAAFELDPLSNAKLVDMRTQKGSTFILGADFEKRRGRGRVQGFFGAGTHFVFNKAQEEYLYGNPISEFNQIPS